MSRTPLHEVLGPMGLQHIALEVRHGMLNAAVSFFRDQLGWTELPDRRAVGDWGEARFVRAPGENPALQLTAPTSDADAREFTENHVAFGHRDPAGVAKTIEEWAIHAGTECRIEEVGGGKWFIHLPDILAFSIEIVPSIF